MFFIIVVFTILLSLITVFRFPRIRSRVTSRLPRLRFSRLFKNQNLKNLFDDRYFFNEHSSKIEFHKLFILVSRDIENLLKNISKETSLEPKWVVPYDATNLFSVIEQNKSLFLILNENLIVPHFNENLNSRIKLLIHRICKIRKTNQINGILYLAQISSITKNKAQQTSSSLKDDILFLNELFAFISKRLNIRIPFYILQYNYEKNDENKKQNIQFYKFIEKYHNLGFSCEFSQFKTSQNNICFLKNKLDLFSKSLKTFCFEQNQNLASTHECLLNIGRIYRAESELRSFVEENITSFLKSIEKDENYPSLLCIMNSNLMNGSFFKKLNSFFDYVSEQSNQYILISSKLHGTRTKYNQIMLVSTIGVLCFSTLCICYGYYDIAKTRQKLFEITQQVQDLEKPFSENADYTSNNIKNLDFLKISSQLQEKYQQIQTLSFRTIYLFPSWSNTIVPRIQNKYLNHFSTIFAENFINNYILFIKQQMSDSYFLHEESSEQLFNKIEEFSKNLAEFNQIYPLLMSKNNEKIQKGLMIVANQFQNIHVPNQDLNLFLNNISDNDLKLFSELHENVSKNASSVMLKMFKNYFESIYLNSDFLGTLHIFNSDLNEFDHLIAKFQKKSSSEGDDNIDYIQLTFAKIFSDYQNFLNSYNNTSHVLSSANVLLNENYSNLIKNIKNNSMFDEFLYIQIEKQKDSFFSKYVDQINQFSKTSAKQKISVISLHDKNEFVINPDITNLFEFFEKMAHIYPFDGTVKSSNFSNEQHVFDEVKLKTVLKKHTEVEDSLDKTFALDESYEISAQFASCLQQYLENSLIFKISSALVPTENSDESSHAMQVDSYRFGLNEQNFQSFFQLLSKPRYKRVLTYFQSLYVQQINEFLKTKKKLLEEKNLFGSRLNTFENWNGVESPAYHLFNLNSKSSLEDAFYAHKRLLYEFYVQNVEKAYKSINVIFDQNPNLTSDYYKFWQSIQKNYEETVFTSQEFQKFVLEDLSQFTNQNCSQIFNLPINEMHDVDYFKLRKTHIQNLIKNKCYSLFKNKSIEAYNLLAKNFNQHLSNRYPFAEIHQEASFVQETNLSHLKSVFKQFNEFKKENMSFLLSNDSVFAERSDIQEFLKTMNLFHNFMFQSQNQEVENDNIKIKTIFEFRTNKSQEYLANRIIDWEFKSGQKSYGSHYGNLENIQFIWEIGSPISINFSLDKSVDLKPVQQVKNGFGVLAKNHQISFSFLHDWALFSLIEKHSTQKFGSSKHTLSFEIALKNDEKIILYCDVSFIDESGEKLSISMPLHVAPYYNKLASNF